MRNKLRRGHIEHPPPAAAHLLIKLAGCNCNLTALTAPPTRAADHVA